MRQALFTIQASHFLIVKILLLALFFALALMLAQAQDFSPQGEEWNDTAYIEDSAEDPGVGDLVMLDEAH